MISVNSLTNNHEKIYFYLLWIAILNRRLLLFYEVALVIFLSSQIPSGVNQTMPRCGRPYEAMLVKIVNATCCNCRNFPAFRIS